ncbi:unnamed protein product [Nezara viridula]|uniref:Uncharacterized protein n=1 Tax=Nezara viridula TaxID=85310 RepID=A0A9P0H477_NEZVI|nr:unnamed protein product [Nezara viridula]
MDQEEEDLIIACCLYEILLEEQRKKERIRKKRWIDNLKKFRERQLARKHQISSQKLRRNEHLGSHPKVNTSKGQSPAKDLNNTYCDEEEMYENIKNPAFTIKVEPGLTDDMYQEDTKDFLAGCSQLIKEEPDSDDMNQEEPLDSMMDFDDPLYIKQEDESNLNSPDVKIKIEPDLSEDDESHDYISE